jgi:hypothetical protein
LIFIGAGMTRYIGFEGIMHIREGGVSNKMVSSDIYFTIRHNGKSFSKKLLLSPLVDNYFSITLPVNNTTLKIEYEDFINKATRALVEDSSSSSKIVLVSSQGLNQRLESFLDEGSSKIINGLKVDFNTSSMLGDMQIKKSSNNSLEFKSPKKILYYEVSSQKEGELEPNIWHKLDTMIIYQINGISVALKKYLPHAKIDLVQGDPNSNALDILKIKITSNNKTKHITLRGGLGVVGQEEAFVFDGKRYDASYGSKYITVEEYKRPKFELEFDKLDESYRLGDRVTVKGRAKAYAGNGISSAKVKVLEVSVVI